MVNNTIIMTQAQVTTVLEKITDKVQSLKKLRSINRGGCGWLAGYVKLYLEAVGENCELVHIERGRAIYESKLEFINAIYDPCQYTSATHVILRIQDKIYFDSTGWGTSEEYYMNKWGSKFTAFNIPAEEYLYHALYNKPEQWNTDYRADKCNPTLMNVVHRAFMSVLKKEYPRDIVNDLSERLEELRNNQYYGTN